MTMSLAESRALRVRCESRHAWIRIVAEVLFFCADLDLDTDIGQAVMETIGLRLAEQTAQDFINHPGIEFVFDEGCPDRGA